MLVLLNPSDTRRGFSSIYGMRKGQNLIIGRFGAKILELPTADDIRHGSDRTGTETRYIVWYGGMSYLGVGMTLGSETSWGRSAERDV